MKDFREENNLCISYGTTVCFDIGENLRCNVASKQLKFGSQFFVCPTPLMAELRNVCPITLRVCSMATHNGWRTQGNALHNGEFRNVSLMDGIRQSFARCLAQVTWVSLCSSLENLQRTGQLSEILAKVEPPFCRGRQIITPRIIIR